MAIVIFSLILIFSLYLAVRSSNKSKKDNMEDYLVGGRSFNGFILFFLAIGEVYSIGTIIGFPGGIYAKGVGYGLWFLGYILLAYPIGYFLAPLIWRAGKKYNAMTAPDLFKSHFGSRPLELIVACSYLIFLIPWGQLQFEGLNVALNALGFNLPPAVAVFIAGIIAYIYISVSGVKAPAIISILKDILLFAAILIVGIAAFKNIGGVHNLFSEAKSHGASLSFGNTGDLTFSVTTIIFQAVAFYCLPFIVNVVFTSKSENTIRKAQRFMPLYMLMYPFLIASSYFALVGIPDLENPNHAFIATAISLLPSWVVGLVAAGAALSGLLVLAITSLVVGGIFTRNLMPNIPENKQRSRSQIVVIVYLLISMVLTVGFPSLMLHLINTAYFGFGQILPGILAIVFAKGATAKGVGAGIITGTVIALTLQFTGASIFSINNGLVALIFNFAVTIIVSLLTTNKVGLLTPQPALKPTKD
ncbi:MULTISPECIES: sodium:solute symporter [unclassified Sporosarcina]|uniref:sodium:solute symporter family protein n=1 Tax=unclassified Sporosarcina TaxID=2647733 RepID=UPI00203BFF72|nr:MULTISPECIES: sodium:solute symporter family protein [unclassified Sporosarcina]GKV65872.1 permease [Sporosarcina sp. NCCP-2331]GLB55997.1 permease [Sporosarcina sp. NCCP-2378]